MARKQVLRLILALFILSAAPSFAVFAQSPRSTNPADTSVAAQLERSIQDAIARAEPSVVAISRTAPPPAPAIQQKQGDDPFLDLRANMPPEAAAPVVGAGVLIDKDGLVLTQYLNIHEGDLHFITTTERVTYPVTIRAADSRSGLAILAIDAKSNPRGTSFHAVAFGEADTLRKGQFVIAIGNPFAIKADGQPTASWGIVTNLAQKAPSGTNLNDAPGPANDYRTTLHHLGTLIQTDAKLGWSTGSGALVNMRGELIGLTTTAATIAGHEQPAGYAIPLNAAFRRIIETLKAGREVEYGMMGVGFGQQVLNTPTGRTSRPTMLQVYPGTPAARAGLQAGDAVTHVNEKPVGDVDQVQLAISLQPPNTEAAVGYVRDGRPATARLTVAKLGPVGKNIVSVRPDSWRGMRVDFATALSAMELAQVTSSGAYDPQGCVLVTEVEEGSDAWKAGIRKGMFVNRVGKTHISTPDEFRAATQKLGKEFDIGVTQQLDPPNEK